MQEESSRIKPLPKASYARRKKETEKSGQGRRRRKKRGKRGKSCTQAYKKRDR